MSEPAPIPLEIESEVRNVEGVPVAVVRIAGEVDLANAEELEAAVFTEPCSQCKAIVLNLLEVPFMDSSGLRVLLVAARDVPARMGLVLGDGSPVQRLLEYAEMTDVMPTGGTEDEVIRALAERSG
jgi:anti-anti-sigma factor